jgi:hypothetical protein
MPFSHAGHERGLASAGAFCATTLVPAVPATIPPMSASDPIAAPQQRIAAQGDHDPHLECLL